MEIKRLEEIYRDARFKALVQGKSRHSWSLTVVMLALYFGFVSYAAFYPAQLGLPVFGGPLNIGLVAGVAIIIVAVAMTGFYVGAVNARFEPLSEAIAKEFQK
jgi:uncharacterized membrane protein (DUF485 family)